MRVIKADDWVKIKGLGCFRVIARTGNLLEIDKGEGQATLVDIRDVVKENE